MSEDRTLIRQNWFVFKISPITFPVVQNQKCPGKGISQLINFEILWYSSNKLQNYLLMHNEYWCSIKKMPWSRLSGSLNSVHLYICIITVLIYKLIYNFCNIITSVHRMDFSSYESGFSQHNYQFSLLANCENQKIYLLMNSLQLRSMLTPSSQSAVVILFCFLKLSSK